MSVRVLTTACPQGEPSGDLAIRPVPLIPGLRPAIFDGSRRNTGLGVEKILG